MQIYGNTSGFNAEKKRLKAPGPALRRRGCTGSVAQHCRTCRHLGRTHTSAASRDSSQAQTCYNCRACMTRTPPMIRQRPTGGVHMGPGEGILRHTQGQDKTPCRTRFPEVSGLTAHLVHMPRHRSCRHIRKGYQEFIFGLRHKAVKALHVPRPVPDKARLSRILQLRLFRTFMPRSSESEHASVAS